jgi:hypothetical protein
MIDMEPKVYNDRFSFDDFYGGDMIKDKLKEVIDFLGHP